MVVNRSAPWARIVPVLAVADVREAVAWYVLVFGFVEHVRGGAGHRVQLGFDGERAELIVRERRPHDAAGEVMVRVDDVGVVLATARDHGAASRDDARDQPYGERQAAFADPFGHTWVVTQTLRDVEPSEWGGFTVVPRR